MLAIYFADLLNNESGSLPSDLLPSADQDLPTFIDHPIPTLEETQKAIQDIKINKFSGLDCIITAEAIQRGCEVMANTVHKFCDEIFTSHTPSDQ